MKCSSISFSSFSSTTRQKLSNLKIFYFSSVFSVSSEKGDKRWSTTLVSREILFFFSSENGYLKELLNPKLIEESDESMEEIYIKFSLFFWFSKRLWSLEEFVVRDYLLFSLKEVRLYEEFLLNWKFLWENARFWELSKPFLCFWENFSSLVYIFFMTGSRPTFRLSLFSFLKNRIC